MISRIMLVLTLCCGPLLLEAQWIEPGALVRVRTLDARHTGTFLRSDPNVIVLQTAHDSTVIIQSVAVQRVHVSTRIPAGRRILKRAGFGMLAGMVTGALLLGAIPNDGCADDCDVAWLHGGVLGAGAGAIIGGISGAFRTTGWSQVPWPPAP